MLNSPIFNYFCLAGNFSGGQDTCLGDSGGGLYIIDNSLSVPRRMVIGITSFGTGCGRSMLPGIYTRVSYHLDFIRLVLLNFKLYLSKILKKYQFN
jgi:secreted trypsin-like serine protease